MPTYRVTFDDNRIGRQRDVRPLVVMSDDLGDLAEAVRQVTAPFLMSRWTEVAIDQDEDEAEVYGLVFAGFHTVARFSVEEVETACSI